LIPGALAAAKAVTFAPGGAGLKRRDTATPRRRR
jgi:hypothetical protein